VSDETRGRGGHRTPDARPPHPATGAPRRERPPHAATLQRRELPPHAATRIAPRAPPAAHGVARPPAPAPASARPPHSAAIQPRADSSPAKAAPAAAHTAQPMALLDCLFGACVPWFRAAPAYVPLANLRSIVDADNALLRSDAISNTQCSGNARNAFAVLTGTEDGPDMADGTKDDWAAFERAWALGDGVFRVDISIGEGMPFWGHAFVLLKVGGASTLYQAFLDHYTMHEWIRGAFEDDAKRPARLRDAWDAARFFADMRALLTLRARDSLAPLKEAFGPLDRTWFANEADLATVARFFGRCDQFHTYWTRGAPRF